VLLEGLGNNGSALQPQTRAVWTIRRWSHCFEKILPCENIQASIDKPSFLHSTEHHSIGLTVFRTIGHIFTKVPSRLTRGSAHGVSDCGNPDRDQAFIGFCCDTGFFPRNLDQS